MAVVSFDFDGVMHLDVDEGGHPHDFFDEDVKPNPVMIKRMREEHANGHEIWIVSARNEGRMTRTIWYFVEKHDLPVTGVIGTSGGDKTDDLRAIGAIRHYDDKGHWADDLNPEDNIQMVIVDPGEAPPPLSKLDGALKKVNKTKRESAVMEAARMMVCEVHVHERKVRRVRRN